MILNLIILFFSLLHYHVTGVSDRDRCPVPRTRVLLEQDILISPHIYDYYLPREHGKYITETTVEVYVICQEQYPSTPQAPNNTRRTGRQVGHRLGNIARKGRFISKTLKINSVRTRFSNQWICSFRSAMLAESFQPPRRTSHSKGYLIPWLPREMVVGADQQPRATGTLLRSIEIHFGGIHSERHFD